MFKKLEFFTIVLLISTISLGQNQNVEKVRLYYLGGQSNMDGYGYNKDDLLMPSGIIRMQGESDASNGEDIAIRYYSNLKRLMDFIRVALRTDDLPVVIGKISDSGNDEDGKVWDSGDLVQYAQEKYTKSDGYAAIVRNTKYYNYSDPWHYDSKGYIDLRQKFADVVYKLNKK